MGVRNYLIEGLSGTGKTTVCDELQRRGYHAVHGDRDLAYQGDPSTGRAREGAGHEHHIWSIERVRSLVRDRTEELTFLCGGSRNFDAFIDLLDGIFVLEVDRSTLTRRLGSRPDSEWGGKPAERARILRWHETGEEVPRGRIPIDATRPVVHVVDEILRRVRAETEAASTASQ